MSLYQLVQRGRNYHIRAEEFFEERCELLEEACFRGQLLRSGYLVSVRVLDRVAVLVNDFRGYRRRALGDRLHAAGHAVGGGDKLEEALHEQNLVTVRNSTQTNQNAQNPFWDYLVSVQ